MPETATGPEIAVRKSLFNCGLRYRIQYPVPGASRRTIDIAFPKLKLAIFIDGCFWHGCSKHRNIPKSNYEWWKIKIEKNKARDKDTDKKLRSAGWTVLRFWEHMPVNIVTSMIEKKILTRRNLGGNLKRQHE